jgi:glycosyltransferase involved in cell wall biosynthesis
MDSNPLVSIIMPTFNHAQFICESLDSVLSQEYSNWECIIVDDGSTDATKSTIERYLKDTRFQYYYKANEGAARAKNFAIDKSKGTYILPLDSDDIIANTYLIKAIGLLERNNNLEIVYCEATIFGAENKKWDIPAYDYKLLLIYNMIFNSAVFKRKNFKKVGGYDNDNSLEDWDLWIKLLEAGGDVYQIPEILFYYRAHKEGSVTNELQRKDSKYIASINAIFKNNIDTYLKVIGNPIELERERSALKQIIKSKEYKAAVKFMKYPVFVFFRNLRNQFKRYFSGK